MSTTSPVVLDELDREGVLVEADDAVISALAATGLVEARPERRGWRLVATGRVGSARIGNLQVDVRPKGKVGLTKLLFLLGYTRDPGWRPELVTAHQETDLWPALAETLVRLARAALGPGVLQGYRTMDDSLRTVRGRIRISDQITRRPGRMVPIEVTYDDFSVDIVENQLLRSALRRMQGVPGLSAASRAGLGHLDGQLAGASVLPPGVRPPTWRQNRRNERYVPALRLAEIVLANCSAEPGPAGVQMASFVVDMAKVYEDFLGAAMIAALAPYPGGTRLQYPSRLDEPQGDGRPGITMAVDIVHTVLGRPVLVFDAKYKAVGPAGAFPNADYYQMLAYCTALKVPAAWLVYAGGPHGRRKIANSTVTIFERSLDLSKHPSDLLTQVDALAAEAWEQMERLGQLGPGLPRAQPLAG